MTATPLQQLQALNAEGRQWFSIAAAAADPDSGKTRAQIRLYDAIGMGWWGITASDFVSRLDALDVDELDLYINCPGGLVAEAVAIKNALVRHRARVTAYVEGMCASAATIVALGADEIVMMPESEWMIHDAWMLEMGPAKVMRAAADRLDQVSDSIAALYARRTGQPAQHWRDIMSGADETWYSAEETVTAGFADRVDDQADPTETTAAKAKLAGAVAALFHHPGRAAAPAPAALAALTLPVASAAGSTPSQVAAAAGDTSQEGTGAMADFTAAHLAALREKVGVRADAEPDQVLAAVDEALAERADGAQTLPPGTTIIDEGTLQQLQTDAAAGREALTNQQAATREALVSAAVRDGRIPPARKEHWLSLLAADSGAADTLAALPKGLVPVSALGHDTIDDAEGPAKSGAPYDLVFPKEA